MAVHTRRARASGAEREGHLLVVWPAHTHTRHTRAHGTYAHARTRARAHTPPGLASPHAHTAHTRTRAHAHAHTPLPLAEAEQALAPLVPAASQAGLLSKGLHRFPESMAVLQHATRLPLARGEPRGWRELGSVLQKRGRRVEALHALSRALALQPETPGAAGGGETSARLAMLFDRMDRHAEAHVAWAHVAALRPYDPDALVQRGEAEWALGRHDEAVARWAAALAVRPSHALARSRERRAKAARRLGDGGGGGARGRGDAATSRREDGGPVKEPPFWPLVEDCLVEPAGSQVGAHTAPPPMLSAPHWRRTVPDPIEPAALL